MPRQRPSILLTCPCLALLIAAMSFPAIGCVEQSRTTTGFMMGQPKKFTDPREAKTTQPTHKRTDLEQKK